MVNGSEAVKDEHYKNYIGQTELNLINTNKL
jgi:hypothetical protein